MVVDESAFGEVDETIGMEIGVSIVCEGQVRHIQATAIGGREGRRGEGRGERGGKGGGGGRKEERREGREGNCVI